LRIPEVFKDFGVGVGLRPAHYNEFMGKKPTGISWVELISENYMSWQSDFQMTKSLQSLERIREQVPIALHGVSLSIGSADKLNRNYLKKLKNLASRFQPMWVSDHLCWTGVDGENLHDLLPLPYNAETIKHVVEKIKIVQDFLGGRILIENVSSYTEFRHSEMKEWEFIREVSERADCGLILDVNNVYVSSVNHGFDPLEYLKAIPPDRVGQIHIAGHTNKGKYLIDTHDAPVCEDVWNLYRWVVQNIGLRSSMIERDGNIPTWDVLRNEALRIQEIREEKSESRIKNPEPAQSSKTI
jgi:uncharacterized protein (UPF0276 family)